MATRPLADLAFARSGSRGDTADLTLFAADRQTYDLLCEAITAESVRALLAELVRGDVTRYEVPNLLALKFVCESALGGGGSRSLRADNLGKALSGALLHLPVDVPDDLHRRLGERSRPPRDPYAGHDWVVR